MEKIKFEGEEIPYSNLPKPCGWRILVGMMHIEERTSGGIVLVDESRKGMEYLRCIGKVLAVGPGAYEHPKFQGGRELIERSPTPWVSVGDIVLINQYSGQSIKVEDQSLKLLNDDEILAVIPDISIINT